MRKVEIKQLAYNRKARYNYSVIDTLECGIALVGTEVKSMKAGKFSYGDAYGRIQTGELWLVGLHITPYSHGNRFNAEPLRTRKLLAHKQEIKRLKRQVETKGLTLVPMKFYTKNGLVKLSLALCKGKRVVDKRETIKSRDQQREAERTLRQRIRL